MTELRKLSRNEQLLLSLLVIKVGGRFANTYGLCKFIDFKFDIFDCSNVIKELIGNDYVTYDAIGGVEVFYLTEKGKDVLRENRPIIVELLKREFPDVVYLIDALY